MNEYTPQAGAAANAPAQPYTAPPGYAAQPVAVPAEPPPEPAEHREVIVVGHSPLVYWWPVWVVGYVMAILTWVYGQPVAIGDERVVFHFGNNLGVLFFLTLFLVIVISNISIRGYASGMVLMSLITAAVLIAYFGAWGAILGWLGDLNIYLNQGAYFWFSTAVFLIWAVTTFLIDHMQYWRITPGQITRVAVFGASSRSYDTENLVLEKRRDDLFKHWILGLGSGDLKMQTYGGRREEILVPNVLFVGSKIHEIQHLIALRPSSTGHRDPG